MANFNSNPTHVSKIGYNGFDMSQKIKFSSTVGELLPVYYDILQPGDKVSLRSTIKTRTMPLETAAMVTLKEHIEWHFVPMQQLYTLFGDWFFGINDFNSSLFSVNAPQKYLPYFDASTFSTILNGLQGLQDYYFGGSNYLLGTGHRLLEMLGIPMRVRYAGATDYFPLSYCPILLCAYQKIFYDYYRDSEREVNDPNAYNLDAGYDTGSAGAWVSQFEPMFRLRYRRWRPDFYTHRFTSPLFGSTSVGSFSRSQSVDADRLKLNIAFHQWLFSGAYGTYSGMPGTGASTPAADTNNPTTVNPVVASQTVNNSGGIPVSVASQATVANYLSPTAIRTSFAVQKLLEVTRRAGKHYDAQQLAHFGVKLNQGIAGESVFIGGTDSEVIIGDVISTAETSNAPLGTIAGKGYNQDSSGRITFEASCHGVLMAIYSAEPLQDYSDRGYDYLNTLLDRASWPTPEFDNLGMQPLFRYQSDIILGSGSGVPAQNAAILGWKYRYFPFKQKYNKVLGSLSHTLHTWSPQTVAVGNVVSSFYIPPYYLDDIMVVQYNWDASVATGTGQASLYDTDPLIHEIFFDVKKSSKMSTFGLEQL